MQRGAQKVSNLRMTIMFYTKLLLVATVKIRLQSDLPLEVWQNPTPARFRKSKSGTALV